MTTLSGLRRGSSKIRWMIQSVMIVLVIVAVVVVAPQCNVESLALARRTSSFAHLTLRQRTTCLYATFRDERTKKKLSSLPKGISPFEKKRSKSLDVQGDFRRLAKQAVDAATTTGSTTRLLEIEFPPLLGGQKSKSQFDDFDNIQELDCNKEWTMLFAPLFFNQHPKTWLLFPDRKECQLTRQEWRGGRYKTATFTTIESATKFLAGNRSYDAPWGATLVSTLSDIMGNKKKAGSTGTQVLLEEEEDILIDGENAPPTLTLVIQPGNGGPVEDWINCEKIHHSHPDTILVIINGALDKVRSGFYPGVFFPKLAATADRFYMKFESVFYLKPISDKGVYGWLFRVYPEPWQVVLQTVKDSKQGMIIEDTVVHVSETRPNYNEAVAKLLEGKSALD